MAYSYHVYEASGSTRAFGVPFPYLAQGHVHASVNGVEVETIEWTSTSTINLPSNPSAGATVRVWRQTPIDEQAVRFSGGVLATKDLNRLALVNLFTAQEALDAATEAKELAGRTDAAALDARNSAQHADAVEASIENLATIVGDAHEDTLAARDEALATVSGAVRYTAQTPSTTEKNQAKSNLGLHAVASSGNYGDLGGRPSLGSAASMAAELTGANTVIKRNAAGTLVESDWDVVICDQRGNATGGGASTTNTWSPRVLNTVVKNTVGATLSGNQVTLPVGTWEIFFNAPAYHTTGHMARLYNVTSEVVEGTGTSEFQNNNYVQTRSFGRAEVSFTTPKTFRIDHFVQSGDANGFGMPGAAGAVETYTLFLAKRVG